MARRPIEKACGPRCRSKQHAFQLNAAITKGSFVQCQLFLCTCYNAASNSDESGRNILHMAASCGQTSLIKGFIEHCKMDINARDSEHGWTALHRALFYGQLSAARLLIKHNASLTSRDKEGLSPLELTIKDQLPHVTFERSGLQEVYTWGDNSNFTLGHEKVQQRKFPERIEYFCRHSISIKQVVMCKYHSVFLSNAGRVYTCGYGRGGRLGHGNEQTMLAPKLVESLKQEECVLITASNDHTIMLMESGKIFSCGLNTYNQLGHSASGSCLSPKLMNSKCLKGHAIIGAIARKFHTILYTRDAVFTFGLNAGQLGHQRVPGERVISQPRLVSAFNHADFNIKLVAASDAATIVATEKGDVYALHEYQCRKIVSKWLDGVQLAVVGGNLDHQVDSAQLRDSGGSELFIAMLTISGHIYYWHLSDPVMHRVVWSIKRPISVKEIALSAQQLLLVTSEGDAFTTSISHLRSRNSSYSKAKTHTNESSSKFMSKESVIEGKLHRVPHIHRATAIAIDRPGVSHAVLQVHPNASVVEIPMHGSSVMSEQMKTLLEEMDMFDSIHDCILLVGDKKLPAHSFILASKSDFLRMHFENNSEEDKHEIKLGCSFEIAQQLMQFFYTDNCDLLSPGFQDYWTLNQIESLVEIDNNSFTPVSKKAGKKSAVEVYKKLKEKEQVVEKPKNAHEQMADVAHKLSIGSLKHRLKFVTMKKGVIVNVPGKLLPSAKIRWEWNKLPDLCDVWLKSDDNEIFACHKCILVARVEYFRSMLSTGWIESGSHDPLSLPIPSDILRVVINYLYTDELTGTKILNDAELLCNVLVVADQMLIKRLKEICEVHLSALVTLKNAADLLELACTYNAVQLKATCHQFIAINLAALLESRSLDILSEDVVDELSSAYQDMIPGMSRRKISAYSGYPSLADLETLEATHSDLFTGEEGDQVILIDVAKEELSPQKKQRRRRSHKSVSEEQPRKMSECSDVEESLCPQSPNSPLAQPLFNPIILQPPAVPTISIRSILPASTPLQSPPQPPSPSTLLPTSPRQNKPDLRDIMKEAEKEEVSKPVAAQTRTKGKKMQRLSQKERARLAMQAKEVEAEKASSDQAKPAWAKPVNAWSATTNLVQSFRELMIEQEETTQLNSKSKPIEVPIRSPTTRRHSESMACSPEGNPWASPASPELNDVTFHPSKSFSKIIEDEEAKHVILQKTLNKPLHLIQIEEQAITELIDSYRSRAGNDERITVERVERIAATPTWHATQ